MFIYLYIYLFIYLFIYWLILPCFIREQCMADATFGRLENKVWVENSAECMRKSSDSLS